MAALHVLSSPSSVAPVQLWAETGVPAITVGSMASRAGASWSSATGSSLGSVPRSSPSVSSAPGSADALGPAAVVPPPPLRAMTATVVQPAVATMMAMIATSGQ